MRSFDKKLRGAISKEEIPIPNDLQRRTELTLNMLPERDRKWRQHTYRKTVAATVMCMLFSFLVLLPNISMGYAQALEGVPVIGKLVEVVTLRSYFYSDDRYELDAEVPMVTYTGDETAENLINQDVDTLTHNIIQHFYNDIELNGECGYGSIHIDYETITNTEEWFTLKLTIMQTAASSNTEVRFYHIDRISGNYVRFGDLFDRTSFEAIEQMIVEQMAEEMQNNEDIVYWIGRDDMGSDITALSETQNFYFDAEGNLVIVYDEYAVGPGSMGMPEFVIHRERYEPYLR